MTGIGQNVEINVPITESKAFRNFAGTTKRSIDLLQMHSKLLIAIQNQTGNHTSSTIADDIARSAIVLSVAAMDSYFTEVFAETLVPILKKRGVSKGLAKFLEKVGFDTEQALIILTMKHPYRRIRAIVDNYFTRYTTQRFGRIDSLFLAYGFKNFSNHVQASLGRRNLVSRIEKLVEHRHDIVHDGDTKAGGRLQAVDIDDILKRVSDLFMFVGASDRMILSKLR